MMLAFPLVCHRLEESTDGLAIDILRQRRQGATRFKAFQVLLRHLDQFPIDIVPRENPHEKGQGLNVTAVRNPLCDNRLRARAIFGLSP